MLKGVSNPGPAFQLDALGGGAYTPRPGVHLHSSSQGSARALLQRFARAGTALRRVQSFCAAVQQAGGSPGSAWASGSSDDAAEAQRQLLALPTVAAFAAAVAQQQQCLQQQLLVIEAALASGAALTLLQLQQRTASMAQQAAVLERLAARCCRRRASAAETAAGLLSGLHEALQVELLQARSQGELHSGAAGAACWHRLLLRFSFFTCFPCLWLLTFPPSQFALLCVPVRTACRRRPGFHTAPHLHRRLPPAAGHAARLAVPRRAARPLGRILCAGQR